MIVYRRDTILWAIFANGHVEYPLSTNDMQYVPKL